MTGATIQFLCNAWRTPALRLAVGNQTYELGRGESPTEVIVHRPDILRGLTLCPSLAFGEAYMRGEIEVHGELKDILRGMYEADPPLEGSRMGGLARWVRRLPLPMSPRRAIANARHHYDRGNDFYRLWLDPSLTYSCAYFLHEGDTLAEAQRNKLALLCRKARLEAGQTLLDIGCGWGSLLFYAAEHYGVHATGITASRRQADWIESQVRDRGLEDRVKVVRGDWRALTGRYDRIISVGMFEHVGAAQYARFFRAWRRLLADGGLSVLHTIGRMKPADPDLWIDRYIFPGGYLPPLGQIVEHLTRSDLLVFDVENLRRHYAETLAAWSANFLAARDRIASMTDECFTRMWWLYLQGAEAAFRWGDLQLWQVVLAKDHRAPWPLNREVNLGGDRSEETLPAL